MSGSRKSMSVCLWCGRPRQSTGPGDRFHHACRVLKNLRAAELAGAIATYRLAGTARRHLRPGAG